MSNEPKVEVDPETGLDANGHRPGFSHNDGPPTRRPSLEDTLRSLRAEARAKAAKKT